MSRNKTIESIVSEASRYPPPKDFGKRAHIKSFKEYRRLYKESIEDPKAFWADRAKQLSWFKKWRQVLDYDFHEAKIRWFEGGKINASFNCLDRHLDTWRQNKAALIWVGDRADEHKIYTYQLLHREVLFAGSYSIQFLQAFGLKHPRCQVVDQNSLRPVFLGQGFRQSDQACAKRIRQQ